MAITFFGVFLQGFWKARQKVIHLGYQNLSILIAKDQIIALLSNLQISPDGPGYRQVIVGQKPIAKLAFEPGVDAILQPACPDDLLVQGLECFGRIKGIVIVKLIELLAEGMGQ